MRLFNFFRKKPAILLTDGLFGEMAYSTYKDASKNGYDGEITLNRQPCGISLEADISGPTQAQKAFYQELVARFPHLKTAVLIPFLNDEMKKVTKQTPFTDFDKEFELDWISLPRVDGRPVHWTLSLYVSRIDDWVKIRFRNWEPEAGVKPGV